MLKGKPGVEHRRSGLDGGMTCIVAQGSEGPGGVRGGCIALWHTHIALGTRIAHIKLMYH
jgi:hypothetical protein